MLEGESLNITRESRLYHSPAFPVGAGPDYVNAVVQVETTLAPEDILAALHRIEAQLGRQRNQRWGARVCDLDLLDCGGMICPDMAHWWHWFDLPPEAQRRETPDRLILPHPRLQDRGFVLVPLAEIAPDWRHPVLGQSALALRDALPLEDLAQITAIDAA